jgi:hypothetical protein
MTAPELHLKNVLAELEQGGLYGSVEISIQRGKIVFIKKIVNKKFYDESISNERSSNY